MKENWTSVWAAGAIGSKLYACAYGGRTLRCNIKAQLSGSAVRLHLTNVYGKKSVEIGEMSVIANGKGLPVLFDGKPSMTLKKGRWVVSDAIKLNVNAGDSIEIRMFLPKEQAADCSTGLLPAEHSGLGNFTRGDFTVDPCELWLSKKRPFEIPHPMPYLYSLDVLTESDKKAVAVFGASNEYLGRWVNPFSKRVEGELGRPVLNLGISGNRLLRDTGIPLIIGKLFGDAGLKRVQWDLFELSGVGTVILHLGCNDVAQPGSFAAPKWQLPSFEKLKNGFIKFAKMCREHGIKVVVLTLTPAGGSAGINESKLTLARKFNAYLLESDAFDAVFDFNKVCRDPNSPDCYLPEYDSGDHLHLNAECGEAIAQAFELSLL